MSKNIKPLDNQMLRELAPSLFTKEPHHKVSDKYHFIPTIDIVEQLRNKGWYPVSVAQSNVRDIDREDFQQHYVRFQHFSDLINEYSRNVIELLLFNSHDRTKSFSIGLGVYRFVCANGLVVADSIFNNYKIKHIGDKENDLDIAVNRIIEFRPKILDKIARFENIELTQEEKESYLQSALPLRYSSNLEINEPNQLLEPLREEDTKNDLYTVLNVLQENLLSTKVSGYNKDTGRKFTSKKITSIKKDIELNKGLWYIAERIASVKDFNYEVTV